MSLTDRLQTFEGTMSQSLQSPTNVAFVHGAGAS